MKKICSLHLAVFIAIVVSGCGLIIGSKVEAKVVKSHELKEMLEKKRFFNDRCVCTKAKAYI